MGMAPINEINYSTRPFDSESESDNSDDNNEGEKNRLNRKEIRQMLESPGA
jgi:hypothetical protein